MPKGAKEDIIEVVRKRKSIILVLVLVPILWFILRFVIGGPEDDWICVNGAWVKHGNPSFPMPQGGCK